MSKGLHRIVKTDKKTAQMNEHEKQLRKAFIHKLKHIKILCDTEQEKQYRLEFYRLLTNNSYRNSCLETLKNCPQKAIANLAKEIIELNINRDILKDAPCLGDEVVLNLYYPQWKTNEQYLLRQ